MGRSCLLTFIALVLSTIVTGKWFHYAQIFYLFLNVLKTNQLSILCLELLYLRNFNKKASIFFFMEIESLNKPHEQLIF